MKPYYQDDAVMIYHGDCRELLPKLRSDVDLVLMDPPFEAEAHTKGRRAGTSGNGVLERPLPFGPITEALRRDVAALTAPSLSGWALMFSQVEGIPMWREVYEAAGLRYIRTCIWVKPNGAPQFTGDRPGMGYESLLAMHTPSPCQWNGGGRHGVFTFNTEPSYRERHPTQKPVALMRELIGLFSNPGDLILDPFMGSGTTLRAAKDLGRKAIGIEIEEKYCEIAAKRMAQEILPLAYQEEVSG